MITLKNNAIFIADSHYNSQRTILHKLLEQIQSKTIVTEQIFLMGDIFDFLSKEIDYFNIINKNVISLINKISLDIEIIYLEGNHDFNLNDIFPNVKVITRSNQPIYIKQNNKTIGLSHGDIFTPKSYDIYTNIIRNHYLLVFLNFIDYNNWLTSKVEKKLKQKEICHKQKNFNNFVQKRINNYNVDLIIEGHYHQGMISENYINIKSLCCDNAYLTHLNGKFNFLNII